MWITAAAKAAAADQVLDVAAEHPQEQHVSQHVQPAAVQEHRGQQRADVQPVRDDAPLLHELAEFVRRHGQLVKKNDDVDRHQRSGDLGSGINPLGRA
jgi:hypothetical protein